MWGGGVASAYMWGTETTMSFFEGSSQQNFAKDICLQEITRIEQAHFVSLVTLRLHRKFLTEGDTTSPTGSWCHGLTTHG